MYIPTGKLWNLCNRIKGPVQLAVLSPVEEITIIFFPMAVFDTLVPRK